MRTISTSTAVIAEASRQSLLKLQSKLVEAQKEVSSGRFADVGVALGQRTGETVSLRREYARLEALIDANSSASTRMRISDTVLKGLGEAATKFTGLLLGIQLNDQGADLARDEARSNLAALTDALNQSVNGAYVFGGINSDVRPLNAYFKQPTGPSRQAVADAFFAEFGITQSDPAARSITPAQMTAFLEGAFADLFEDPAWTANWSNASDQNIVSQISPTELLTSSVSANDPAIRKLARAYTMIADLGVENLSTETFKVVADAAAQAAAEAASGVTTLRAKLGAAQARLTAADERMSLQADIMTSRINDLEEVDPYEAATRVTTLSTQIEAAYSLTARIQKLSLLNYL